MVDMHPPYTPTVEMHENIHIAKYIHKVIFIDLALRIFHLPTRCKVENGVTSQANIVRINKVI